MNNPPPLSNFSSVAQAIINLLPNHLPNYQLTINRINHIREGSAYKHPKAMDVCWEQLGSVLEDSISTDQDSEDWAVKISKVIIGEIDYRQFLEAEDDSSSSSSYSSLEDNN